MVVNVKNLNMNKLIVLFVLFLCVFNVCGHDKLVKYYDSKWKETSMKKAIYFREISVVNDSVFFVQDFLNKKKILLSRGYFKSVSPYIEHGPMEYFDEMGKLVMKGKYVNGELSGIWIVQNYFRIEYAELDYNFPLVYETKKINKDSLCNAMLLLDEQPEYPGGGVAIKKYLSTNIVTPYSAFKYDISVSVIVNFVINEEGKVEDIKIDKPGFKDYDKEAARVIRDMPIWKPGVLNGKKVRAYYSVPFNFTIDQ